MHIEQVSIPHKRDMRIPHQNKHPCLDKTLHVFTASCQLPGKVIEARMSFEIPDQAANRDAEAQSGQVPVYVRGTASLLGIVQI